MRVGLLCPYSLSIPGGVQGQVLGLARALRRRGHEARVLAPCDGPPPDAFVTPLGKSVPAAANGSVAPLAPDPAAQLRTMRALWDEDFDILHLHEPFAPGPCMTALMIKPAPTIGTFHAAGESFAYKHMGAGTRFLNRRLDLRCAVSEDARALASSAVSGAFTLLFNGVDLGAYREGRPWPTEGPTIFFCGRHEPRKGLAVLLEAMAGLPGDVRLWVGSDGPETAALQARWAGDPRVEWLGRLSDEEKAARLRGADVFCAPSLRGESFGVVLIEAMAAETPIVASELPGYANVARAGQDAELVPPGDPRALAAAVTRLLDDEELRRRVVASGRRRAEEFSMDRLADRYVELYGSLVESRR
ncbi:MAG TPA: glycosyltransferase family 4 protein [Acidimicrobiales bacterium]